MLCSTKLNCILVLIQLPGYDPCIDYYIPRYLNNPDVQKALHARADTNWSGCK